MPPPDLLEVRDLRVAFATHAGPVLAVDGVSFSVARGEVVGVVGESGCGKTVTALSIPSLLPPAGRILPGSSIRLEGEELVGRSERGLQRIRGERVGVVFQEPMTSLNPVLRVGTQVEEAILAHRRMSRKEARERAAGLLAEVGLPDPGERLRQYPHQLSGGMRQRVMLAAALACEPDLLVADEPTTALDVTTQAEILERLLELRRSRGMGLLLVTHDLGVVAGTCDRVVVMYAGQVVEKAPTSELFREPRHPYTRGLLGALPRVGGDGHARPIPGGVPEPGAWPPGCRFAPRCPWAWDLCRGEAPPLFGIGGEAREPRTARCWLEAKE